MVLARVKLALLPMFHKLAREDRDIFITTTYMGLVSRRGILGKSLAELVSNRVRP